MSEGRAKTLEAAAAERWSLPSVEGPIIGARRPGEERVFKAEHASGYEAGLADARAEMEPKLAELGTLVRHLDAVCATLARPLEELDAAVQEQLTLLALAVGKQLARRELKADPTQIVAIIREAVARLPIAARDIRVHLHPQDASVVRERLAAPTAERAWTIVEDPTLTRGGCLVRTDTSQVDARLDSRVNAIVSLILGEERSVERSSDASPSADGA
jgi:flagellar assembly protein FliH